VSAYRRRLDRPSSTRIATDMTTANPSVARRRAGDIFSAPNSASKNKAAAAQPMVVRSMP
jgi:hypothetical protein